MMRVFHGHLTVDVQELWAHTPRSPLHRTTAVGAGKAAAERGDPAGTLHLFLHIKKKKENTIQVQSASLCWLHHRGGLYLRGHNRQQLPGAILTAQRERRTENFWLLLRDFLPHLLSPWKSDLFIVRGWDRYSFPSPCVWAPLSRSMWKVSGKSVWLSSSLSKHFSFARLALWRGSTIKLITSCRSILTQAAESGQVEWSFKRGKPTWITEMRVYGEAVLFAEYEQPVKTGLATENYRL